MSAVDVAGSLQVLTYLEVVISRGVGGLAVVRDGSPRVTMGRRCSHVVVSLL